MSTTTIPVRPLTDPEREAVQLRAAGHSVEEVTDATGLTPTQIAAATILTTRQRIAARAAVDIEADCDEDGQLDIAALLTAGTASTRQRTRTLATRIRVQIDELRFLVEREQREQQLADAVTRAAADLAAARAAQRAWSAQNAFKAHHAA